MSTYEELMSKSRELHAAGDIDGAKRVAKIALDRKGTSLSTEANRRQATHEAPQASPVDYNALVRQAGAGATEGLAAIFSLPSTLADTSTDLITGGINKAFGTDLKISQDIPGGPRMGTYDRYIQDAQSLGVMPTEGPQTAGQNYARRAGQDIGAMLVPGGLMASATKAPLKTAGMEVLSALTSAGAGETASQMGGGSTVQMIAEMLGGLTPVGAMRPKPDKAPTMDELKARQSAAYSTVESANAKISKGARDDIIAALRKRAGDDNVDPYLHPRASRTLDRMDALEANPSIHDIEQKRQLIGRDVAGALEPSERRIGSGMKDELDSYLSNLAPSQVVSGNADEAIGALGVGRETTKRIKNAELIDEMVTKGERRAASSGTGGNEVNAIRQNIRSILDNPKKRRGFSENEISAMEDIVRGNPTTNALRMLGRLSPTSGALPMIGLGAGSAALGPMGAIPSAAGYFGKAGAEALTQKQVKQLSELVRNGAPLDPTRMTEAQKAVVAAMMAGQVSNASAPIQSQ